MEVSTTNDDEANVMREILTVVTRKGQITVPVEIRRALALREGDKVGLLLEDNQVRMRRAGSVIARTAGMLKGTESPLSAEDMREAVERAIAEENVVRFES